MFLVFGVVLTMGELFLAGVSLANLSVKCFKDMFVQNIIISTFACCIFLNNDKPSISFCR